MGDKERLYSLEGLLTQLAKNGSNMYGYFIRERRGILPDELAQRFGIPSEIENLPDWLVGNGNVDPQSVGVWREFFSAIERGDRKGSVSLPLRSEDGCFDSYWLRFNGILDEQGEPYFAMISFDVHSAEVRRLRDELSVRSEEIRLTMSKMIRVICHYDIHTSTLKISPSQAKRRDVPEVTRDFPESFIEHAPQCYPPEARETIRGFYDAIRRGEPSGECEYYCLGPEGAGRWERLEFSSVFDSAGKPTSAVIAVDDVTDRHMRTEENEQLRENERLLRLIAQHSDRIICHYDVELRMARRWDDEICAKCKLPRLCEMTSDSVLASGGILPESVDSLRKVFRDIGEGKPQGAIKMRARTTDGECRWFDLQYSTLHDDSGAPVSALISHKDITEQYEHEIAYLRYVQSLALDPGGEVMFIESDLTSDLIDSVSGNSFFPGCFGAGCSHSDIRKIIKDQKFLLEDRGEFAQYLSREKLLEFYSSGKRRLQSEWRARFTDGSARWLYIEVVLMSDPYTRHIKAFFRISDITEEKERKLEIQRRSERDGMTGLLNRSTSEERIREQMALDGPPGIMALLDLDDLKKINDAFGHNEGDRAIIAIADTLRGHFRDTDIIGRVGGDEFIVYLAGASSNSDAIAISLTSLLRKLASIPIGRDDERRIHCSIGCAIQLPSDDTFEALFKRADTALYHVKRNSKNNYAFYLPEMDQADYQFQTQKLFALRSAKKFETAELQHLLGAISSYYQLVLSVNLSENQYYLMDEVRDGVFSRMPTFGSLDVFVKATADRVHPDEVSAFLDALSRQALMHHYRQGEKCVRLTFRFGLRGGYRLTEAAAIFYTNDNGDVCDFTLVRWAD